MNDAKDLIIRIQYYYTWLLSPEKAFSLSTQEMETVVFFIIAGLSLLEDAFAHRPKVIGYCRFHKLQFISIAATLTPEWPLYVDQIKKEYLGSHARDVSSANIFTRVKQFGRAIPLINRFMQSSTITLENDEIAV